jgi:hypothetical protein
VSAQSADPIWWRLEGSHMRLAAVSFTEGTLSILSPQAELHLSRSLTANGWVVRWSVKHTLESTDDGSRWLTSRELQEAFGLAKSDISNDAIWDIALRFGAEAAKPNRYIRRGLCLCLPGPTYPDSRAECWISVQLDTSIKSAVEQLIKHHPNGGSPNPDVA